MNHLLNPISWSTYLETIAVLAIIYYAFIGWKYYRQDIIQLFVRLTGKKEEQQQLTVTLQNQGEDTVEANQPDGNPVYDQQPEIQTTTADDFSGPAADLAQTLKDAIREAAARPYAPVLLINQLKRILNDHPDIAASPEREKINALIIQECEKTGTALLSESEVDVWWSA